MCFGFVSPHKMTELCRHVGRASVGCRQRSQSTSAIGAATARPVGLFQRSAQSGSAHKSRTCWRTSITYYTYMPPPHIFFRSPCAPASCEIMASDDEDDFTLNFAAPVAAPVAVESALVTRTRASSDHSSPRVAAAIGSSRKTRSHRSCRRCCCRGNHHPSQTAP